MTTIVVVIATIVACYYQANKQDVVPEPAIAEPTEFDRQAATAEFDAIVAYWRKHYPERVSGELAIVISGSDTGHWNWIPVPAEIEHRYLYPFPADFLEELRLKRDQLSRALAADLLLLKKRLVKKETCDIYAKSPDLSTACMCYVVDVRSDD